MKILVQKRTPDNSGAFKVTLGISKNYYFKNRTDKTDPPREIN